MTHPERPLAGRSVLVTRNPGQWPGLLAHLESLGATATFRSPTQQVAAGDAEALNDILDRLASFHWIVFTSRHGVGFFCDAARRRGVDLHGLGLRAAVVGDATGEALEARLGRPADLVSREGHGRALARGLMASASPGERVLVVRPEVSAGTVDEGLREAGLVLEDVAVYRTEGSPWAADLAAAVARGEHDVIVFTAPSAVDAIFDASGALRSAVEEGLGATRRVALGPTTAKALEGAGFPAHAIASRPTEAAVADAVVAASGADPTRPTLC